MNIVGMVSLAPVVTVLLYRRQQQLTKYSQPSPARLILYAQLDLHVWIIK